MAPAEKTSHNTAVNSPERHEMPLHAQKMEVLGRLASSVIHDLNNLLTVIQLNAALIEEGDLDPKEASAVAQKISDASRRSADLTRKVLNFARRQPEESKPVELGEMIDGLGRMLDSLVARRVEIVIGRGAAPVWVRGNRGALEQALMNLVLNAVDAMADGGKVSIVHSARDIRYGELTGCPAGRYALIEVIDNGAGIPPDVRDKIFEPFFTTKDFGTGMGLAIVDRVARLHRGTVTFESAPGRGTTFRLWLPWIAAPTEEKTVAKAEVPAPVHARMVLLVEDDVGIRELARYLLEKMGLRVLAAGTGPEALELWEKHRNEVNLLFTDLVLAGGLSGRDVALRLLAERPSLPVIYTSGYSSAWSDHSIFTENNFLPKPFPPTALQNMVKAALARI
jgi:nitrogen-specific signal transduction histidine kinase/CheY-like chemotaxis protein